MQAGGVVDSGAQQYYLESSFLLFLPSIYGTNFILVHVQDAETTGSFPRQLQQTPPDISAQSQVSGVVGFEESSEEWLLETIYNVHWSSSTSCPRLASEEIQHEHSWNAHQQ